jgi:hypothetical protein
MGIRVLVFQLRLLGFGSKYYMFKILYVICLLFFVNFIFLDAFHMKYLHFLEDMLTQNVPPSS